MGFLYFEDIAGVMVNNKGERKGSAITEPFAKECADLWMESNTGNTATLIIRCFCKKKKRESTPIKKYLFPTTQKREKKGEGLRVGAGGGGH